ncbi:MAG: hypothetical protein JSR36_15355 [Proteobacteria bacterium]|nr:hypothetical protein [Pseudomonadota bacterium]
MRGLHTQLGSAPAAAKRQAVHGPREIRFPGAYRATDPVLPLSKLNEAVEMAAVYPLLYVLENSMREVVRRMMHAAFGDNWWDTQLTSGRLRNVHKTAADRRVNEKAWHQRRGSHPIDYVDLVDLGDIITGKRSTFFPALMDDVEWFRTFMKELAPSRNVVCHMNPLQKHNVDAVKLSLHRWQAIVQAAGAAIPSA